jgi:hypothetical protein
MNILQHDKLTEERRKRTHNIKIIHAYYQNIIVYIILCDYMLYAPARGKDKQMKYSRPLLKNAVVKTLVVLLILDCLLLINCTV